MASEDQTVVEGMRIRVGIPVPGLDNTPEIEVFLAESNNGLYDIDEVARLINVAVVSGWCAAFDFVHSNTEQWRANAVAHAEKLRSVALEAHNPQK